MNFVRFVALPIWFAAMGIWALVTGLWALGAIAGIFLVYYLMVVRSEYGDAGWQEEKSWLGRLIEALTVPSRLGFALLAAGASLLVAALAFGFTVGVAVGIGIWVGLLVACLAAVFRRSRADRQ